MTERSDRKRVSPLRGRSAIALAVLLAALAPERSFAGSPDDETKSRQLFKQAETLANDGKWKEACHLYQAAHDLNSTGGTALRTADCYEKIGDYDHALGMYQYIVDHGASDKNQERVALAEKRVTALKKQLGKDQPSVAQKPPVDQKTPPPLPTATTTSEPEVPPPSRVPAGIAFGVGGAGLVLGAVFGGLAMAQASGVKSDAKTQCPTGTCNNPDLDSRRSAAITKGWVANIGFGVAIAGAVTGVVLLATAKSPKAEQQRAVQKAQSFVTADGLRIRF